MAKEKEEILIVGGGLAGSEAAWQARLEGVEVTLFEMRPVRYSPAHRSPHLAELVCSNSLRSRSLDTASGLLKEELRRFGSVIHRAATETAVPAGAALAVDREAFARRVTSLVEAAGVRVVRREITQLPPLDQPLVLATGPLPSDAIAAAVQRLTGADSLYFYDAIAPIVDGATINLERAFWGSRYGKGGQDYLNCPLDRETYYRFVDEILRAEKVPLRDFEQIPPFEGCLPIEDLALRGRETLAHGPMRPVGLCDPGSGRAAYAVVQLRQDNAAASLFNMVGFQTKMIPSEQKRVLRMIPGLEQAEFFRFGSLHRNAFVNSPRLLLPTLQLRGLENLFLAGQMTGVEGYIESVATGLIAGRNAARLALSRPLLVPPETTAIGALLRYTTHADPESFQPMHCNFGLLPPPAEAGRQGRKARREAYSQRALLDLDAWLRKEGTRA